MNTRLVTLWLALAALTAVGDGYLMYADRIPNGRFVPHPCKPNVLWKGVGHFNQAGGGHRNAFGLDFKAADLKWTEELCRKDSDDDGRTNGEELGDPDCVWVPDTLPARSKYITHPGVCDPIDSLECKRKSYGHTLFRTQEEWMADACKSDEFVCDALNSADVKNQTLRFPPTSVPAKETTYMCVVFDIVEPSNDVHLVATKPILDNLEVMHHMLLFGCEDKEVNDRESGVPYECGMNPHRNCSTIIGLWTIGVNGECLPDNIGRPMGHTKVALQFHYNNPEKVTTYNDSSGMVLYYTREKRTYDTAVMLVGSTNFAIPPGQKEMEVKSTCASSCTARALNQTVYVTSAFNHMHYLGVRQTVELIRNGRRVNYITNDPIYSYDSPKVHKHANPVAIHPGDELRTKCHYNSMSRRTTTVYGDSTQQEMCYGFISVYPKSALRFSSCTTYGTISRCDPSTLRGCNEFQFSRYMWMLMPLYQAVTGNCTDISRCFAECKAVIVEAKQRVPCMRHEEYWGKIKKMIMKSPEGQVFLARLASCEPEIARDEALASCPKVVPVTEPISEATPATGRSFMVALLLCLPAMIF